MILLLMISVLFLFICEVVVGCGGATTFVRFFSSGEALFTTMSALYINTKLVYL
jgi:hypothetical protein